MRVNLVIRDGEMENLVSGKHRNYEIIVNRKTEFKTNDTAHSQNLGSSNVFKQ